MAVTWDEADGELIGVAQRLIREHHAHLLDAKMGFMYRSEAAKSGNKMIVGKARKVSEEQQVFIDFDFVIWIAKDVFEAAGQDLRDAMVDHELCHCWGMFDDWKIRQHDFEEFNAVIVRHGLWRTELSFAAKSFENAGKGQQALFFPPERGEVASVPKVVIKQFSSGADLLEEAREDPEKLSTEIFRAAEELKRENGGECTVSFLQRKLHIGYAKAAAIKHLLDQVSGAE